MTWRTHKYRFLLLSAIGMLGVEPLAPDYPGAGLAVDAAFWLLAVGILIAVFRRHRQRLTSLCIGVPALAAYAASFWLKDELRASVAASSRALVAAFFGYAVIVILRGIFTKREILFDDVVGAFCGFLFAGLAWANVYALIETVVPGSFDVSSNLVWMNDDDHLRRGLYNYFSFCTITTVGFGDVTPIRPVSCWLCWLEAMFGQFYVAVVVAQIVGLKLAHAVTKNAESAT